MTTAPAAATVAAPTPGLSLATATSGIAPMRPPPIAGPFGGVVALDAERHARQIAQREIEQAVSEERALLAAQISTAAAVGELDGWQNGYIAGVKRGLWFGMVTGSVVVAVVLLASNALPALLALQS